MYPTLEDLQMVSQNKGAHNKKSKRARRIKSKIISVVRNANYKKRDYMNKHVKCTRQKHVKWLL